MAYYKFFLSLSIIISIACAPSLSFAKETEKQIHDDKVAIEETYNFPDYPLNAMISTGTQEIYVVEEEDTLLDISRHFNMGYVEIRAANPDIDPWAPMPGAEVVIPSFHLLPRAKQEGIIVNLSEMRLYFFKTKNSDPISFPIGIGRDGLSTPKGETTIVRKRANPTWSPTPRMRKESPYLPATVPAGPSNPLGTHALYLGWPTFLIHGSNKPWAIGRRVSSGCMRLYPEDIIELFKIVPIGTKVTIVEQPILIGWVNDKLYLEAIPDEEQSTQLELEGEFTVKPLTDKLRESIVAIAGDNVARINWRSVEKAVRERHGIPIVIADIGNKTSVNKSPKAGYNK